MILVLFGIIVVFMIVNRNSQKKRQQETQNMLDAIQPGHKVKTIGGICGVVVEVCHEDNTFVLETGTEASGKSYITFDKQAVYQTNALDKEETPVEDVLDVEEAPFEEAANDAAEEAPVEETADAE
jgi:preprotein translocase subunit YajC